MWNLRPKHDWMKPEWILSSSSLQYRTEVEKRAEIPKRSASSPTAALTRRLRFRPLFTKTKRPLLNPTKANAMRNITDEFCVQMSYPSPSNILLLASVLRSCFSWIRLKFAFGSSFAYVLLNAPFLFFKVIAKLSVMRRLWRLHGIKWRWRLDAG